MAFPHSSDDVAKYLPPLHRLILDLRISLVTERIRITRCRIQILQILIPTILRVRRIRVRRNCVDGHIACQLQSGREGVKQRQLRSTERKEGNKYKPEPGTISKCAKISLTTGGPSQGRMRPAITYSRSSGQEFRGSGLLEARGMDAYQFPLMIGIFNCD